MNLVYWVLVGGAAGILAGILFGDFAILRPIGFAYVGLLLGRRLSLSHLLPAARPGIPGAGQGMAALHSDEMVHFVNYWLDLRKADGMRAREFDYWILLGQPRT
jgi:hypothetical protein